MLVAGCALLFAGLAMLCVWVYLPRAQTSVPSVDETKG